MGNKKIDLLKYELVTLDYRTVKPLQGELKRMDAQAEKKLLQSLQDEGKFVPEFVWFDEESGEWYAMDGHQRLSIYAKHDITFNDSYDVPFLKVAAKDKEEAAKRLLLINSDFGKITRQGLMDFVTTFKIGGEWMNQKIELSGFGNFDFVSEANRIMEKVKDDKVGERPMPPPPPPVVKKEEVPQKPTASGNEWASWTELLKASTKDMVVDTVRRVKDEQGFAMNHEAIQYIFDKFNSL